MSIPLRYPYNPSRKLIALGSLGGAPLMVLAELGLCPRTPALVGTGVLSVLYGLLVLRRCALPRSLVLDDDSLWLPTGFLQMYVTRVRFAEIDALWERELPLRQVVLSLRSGGRTLDIFASFLPDEASYHAVDEFLLAHVEAMRPGPVAPSRVDR